MQFKTLVFLSLTTLLTSIGPAAHAQRLRPSNSQCGEVQSKAFINWPQFHFDPCHTGYNPYEHILSPSDVGNLELDWKYQTPNGWEGVESSPAVVDGVVYFGGFGFGLVYALDARTGALVWRTGLGQFSDAGSPAVAYGNVYVVSYLGSDGYLRVLNAATGDQLWTGGCGDNVPVSIPTVANGAVYGADSHMGLHEAGDVCALDANTGALLWRDMMQYGVGTSPAAANGMVYAGCDYASHCAFDGNTGATLWRFTPQGLWGLGQAAVSNGTVYLGAIQQLGEGENYAISSYLFALNATTGAVLWQQPLGASLGDPYPTELTTPAVANGVIYIATSNEMDYRESSMYALDANTGALLWKYMTQGGIQSSPAVANGVVYFGANDGNIYALDATTGALLWKYATGDEYAVVSSPAVVNGTLYIGSGTYMYAFHLPN